MRLGPLRLTCRRATRALAGLVAMFLLAGNVLAAAGLCAVKAPLAAGTATEVSVVGDPSESGCSGHHAEPNGPASADHHCPTDDPSAQSRAVDVPAAQLMPALAASLLPWSEAELRSAPLVVTHHPAESRPLYARLQRLRL